MSKKKYEMTLRGNRALTGDIFEMILAFSPEDKPVAVVPGQFVGVYPKDSAMLLPRPVSICGYDAASGQLRLVYRTAGAGTRSLAELKTGESLQVLGILGNGYDLAELEGRKVLLLGGGVGIPPLLELAGQLAGKAETAAVLGYRDRETFLAEDFEKYCRVYIASEDGSKGVRGNVLDAVREHGLDCDVICACGPLPMLRAVKAFALEKGADCYISLEERMACGVGACLGCVCGTAKEDPHSHVNNARVCTEGPVFEAGAVTI